MNDTDEIQHRRGCAGGRTERFSAIRPGRADWRTYRGGAIEVSRRDPVPMTVTRCLECGEQEQSEKTMEETAK